jgi:DNA processing protein
MAFKVNAPDEVIVTLGEVAGVGSRKAKGILQAFPEISSWKELIDCDLEQVDGVSKTLARSIREAEPGSGSNILGQLPKLQSRYIHYWQDEYPAQLRALYDAPVGLYVRGPEVLEGDFMAVVGTRQPSEYGRDQTRRISQELVAAGLGIVSGFARGIDTAAHKAALESGGQTIAVLGCGVDVVYPAENRKLYRQLLEQGAAVSEYPPGAGPDAHHFPQRNRIISGLALGALVVEAGIGSGALITAYRALDQDREVFALPGRADNPKSAGCHLLIQKGAKLVTKVEDILAELSPPYALHSGQQMDILSAPQLTQSERDILDFLKEEPVQVDRIAEELHAEVSELLSLLLQLEMKGLVKQAAGKRFGRVGIAA